MLLDYLDKDNKEWKNTEAIYRQAEKDGDKETIFKCYHRLALGTVCKMLNKCGLSTEQIQEKALDLAIFAMERTKRKKYDGKMTYATLATWIHYSALEFLYNPQTVFEEKIQYLEEENNNNEKNQRTTLYK